MKRVLFLLLITASAITVSAQKDYRNNDRDNSRYHYKYDGQRDLGNRRDEYRRQVASINNTFDLRISSIRNSRHMSRRQKKNEIRELEMRRQVALNECRDRFAARSRDYARERDHRDRRY